MSFQLMNKFIRKNTFKMLLNTSVENVTATGGYFVTTMEDFTCLRKSPGEFYA